MNPDMVCREIWDTRTTITHQGDTSRSLTPPDCQCLDVLEYARKVGIRVEEEEELLVLAREALNTRLPECWKPW